MKRQLRLLAVWIAGLLRALHDLMVARASNAKMDPKAQMGSLPPELKLNVLSNLPAKDLNHIRTLNRDYKALPDQHWNMILTGRIAVEQERIRASHHALFRTCNLSFGEAFRNFLAHYGPIPNKEDRACAIRRFCANYIEQRFPRISTVTDPREFSNALIRVMTAIVDACRSRALNYDQLCEAIAVLNGLVDRDVLEVHPSKILDYLVFSNSRRSSKSLMSECNPGFALTMPLHFFTAGSTVHMTSAMTAWLGVPRILHIKTDGQYYDRYSAPFAYYVRNRAYRDLAQDPAEGRRKDSTLFEKLVALEEVFIW